MNVALQVLREAVVGRGEPHVFGKMGGVGRIAVRQRQRPAPARRHRNRLDVETRKRARRKDRVFEQVALVQSLDGDDGAGRRMRHRGEIALAADPYVAEAIRHRRVKQGNVARKRRQQHDRVIDAERIVDHAPVRPLAQHVGSDQSAQRNER
jgi:hypothetical protein